MVERAHVAPFWLLRFYGIDLIHTLLAFAALIISVQVHFMFFH